MLRDSWLLIMFASGMQFACLRVTFLFPVARFEEEAVTLAAERGVSAACLAGSLLGSVAP